MHLPFHSRPGWVPLLLTLAFLVLVWSNSGLTSRSVAAGLPAMGASTLDLIWTERAPMPTARSALGAALAPNGRIYAIGGAWVSALATVEEYDPPTDTWRTRAPMPTARSLLGVVTGSNGKIYAIGGADGGSADWRGGALATVEEYEPATDSWTRKASMPTARWGLAAAAGANGRIYAIGGSSPVGTSPATVLATVEEYDPAGDTWRTRSPMKAGRYGLAATTAANGMIYVAGGGTAFYGQPTGQPHTAIVESYDPTSDRWTTEPPMRVPRSSFGLATASTGRIYAMGGIGADSQPGFGVEDAMPPWIIWARRSGLGRTLSSHALVATADRGLYGIQPGLTAATTVPVLPPPSVTYFPLVSRSSSASW